MKSETFAQATFLDRLPDRATLAVTVAIIVLQGIFLF